MAFVKGITSVELFLLALQYICHCCYARAECCPTWVLSCDALADDGGSLVPNSNKVHSCTLEQPPRAGMIHKVRDITLGS